ncbi:MAG: radical SAM protein [Candidatus Hydrogenedentes bacterium]|nr:radical SAM protein [Candidatus Hydrogenedentota bacterium]
MAQTILPYGIANFARKARHVLDFGGVWLARHLNRSPRSLPILILMLTDKCNLKCKMCGACDYTPGDHNLLSLDEWKAVVDAAARLRTQVVAITGGEAMLRHDLFDLIRHVRGLGMAVHLNTNGLLLRDKNVAKLAESGVETVSISIESPDAAVHDAIRGRGTFQHTLDGLRRLRAAAPDLRIGLNSVINKHNYKTLAEMVPFAVREGVDQLKLAPIHTNLQHKGKNVDEYADMIFQEPDLDGLERELSRMRAALAKTNLETTLDQFFDGITDHYRPPATNFYCYAGFAIMVVGPQGYVSACFDKDSPMNVRETPLDEIWRSRAFHEHRQLARHCDRACWDTANTELSMRLSVLRALREPRKLISAIRYYTRRGRQGRRPGDAARPACSRGPDAACGGGDYGAGRAAHDAKTVMAATGGGDPSQDASPGIDECEYAAETLGAPAGKPGGER